MEGVHTIKVDLVGAMGPLLGGGAALVDPIPYATGAGLPQIPLCMALRFWVTKLIFIGGPF